MNGCKIAIQARKAHAYIIIALASIAVHLESMKDWLQAHVVHRSRT